MQKCIFILFGLLSFSYSITSAQSTGSSFVLEGVINIDTGKVELILVADSTCYSFRVPSNETKIVNGKFEFKGKISFPSAFQILLDRNYISGIFYIDSGEQTIICNADS